MFEKREYTVILTYPLNGDEPVEFYTSYVKASSRQQAAILTKERARIDNDHTIEADDFSVAFILDGWVTFLSIDGL